MFDIGFGELVLVLVIALLVVGPERLPGVVRTAGLWLARLRRSFQQIRTEIEREAHLDEIKRDLHNQSILESLKGTADDLGKLRDLPYDVTDVVRRHNKPGPVSKAPTTANEDVAQGNGDGAPGDTGSDGTDARPGGRKPPPAENIPTDSYRRSTWAGDGTPGSRETPAVDGQMGDGERAPNNNESSARSREPRS